MKYFDLILIPEPAFVSNPHISYSLLQLACLFLLADSPPAKLLGLTDVWSVFASTVCFGSFVTGIDNDDFSKVVILLFVLFQQNSCIRENFPLMGFST